MRFFVGLDVSKKKFDACFIGDKEEKVFTLHTYTQRNHDMRNRMRQSRTSGSVGGEGNCHRQPDCVIPVEKCAFHPENGELTWQVTTLDAYFR
jgi:hypothetical protein